MDEQSLIILQIVIPKLERICIDYMENLKEIWPCEQVYVSSLREIKVSECHSLMNLFPCNPMPLLQHLEELPVRDYGAIKVLFNIDMDRVREVECTSSLRSIHAWSLVQLRENWRVKGLNKPDTIFWFQAIETIHIGCCKSFRNVITPSTSCFDMRALSFLRIVDCGESRANNELVWTGQEQEQEISTVTSEKDIDELSDNNFTLMRNFHHLHSLIIYNCDGVEMVFEIDSPSSSRESAKPHQQQLQLFPKLKILDLNCLKRMSHVWKCSNRNEFLRIQKQQQVISFHDLTTISMYRCHNIKYLFSSHMAELLSNLKVVEIKECNGIEEVVSNTHNEDGAILPTSSTSNQRKFLLDSLDLYDLKNLKHIGGAAAAAKSGSKNDHFAV